MDTSRCIWMEAGAVEYQLCPLNHNCDQCDFHHEMIRGCRTGKWKLIDEFLQVPLPLQESIEFTAGLHYLDGHFWFKRKDANHIQLGLDQLFWSLMPRVIHIVTPKENQTVAKNDCFSWILIDGGIIYLRCPLSGTVSASNPAFQLNQSMNSALHLDVDEDLWILELDIRGQEQVTALGLNKDGYLRLVQKDIGTLKKVGDVDQAGGQVRLSKSNYSNFLKGITQNRAFVC